MRPRLSRAREALKAFIETSHDNDDFCVVAFNHRPRLLGESVTGETATRLLSGIYAFGGTALYDAVYLGAEGVKRGVHKKRALLVISDGQDNSSFYTYRELQRLLQESDIQVYCIGVEDSTWGFIDAMDEQGRAILEQLDSTASDISPRALFATENGAKSKYEFMGRRR
jgi:Ca-activated chloride channel family protein